jgi:hypothetical protein
MEEWDKKREREMIKSNFNIQSEYDIPEIS